MPRGPRLLQNAFTFLLDESSSTALRTFGDFTIAEATSSCLSRLLNYLPSDVCAGRLRQAEIDEIKLRRHILSSEETEAGVIILLFRDTRCCALKK